MKRGVKGLSPPEKRFLLSLLVVNALAVSLWLIRIIGSGVDRYGFMLWNLFLAWLPLGFSTALVQRLSRTRWSSWRNLGLTLLWFLFLPNSFYLLTDLIHLQSTGEINIMYDTVLMVSFIFSGLVVGYLSLYQIHQELLKRVTRRQAHGIVGLVLLCVGFAIYLGRLLRWNSWDILLHPTGLLFDISDRIIHPIAYPEAILTTVTFWLLLSAMYYFCRQLVHLIRREQSLPADRH